MRGFRAALPAVIAGFSIAGLACGGDEFLVATDAGTPTAPGPVPDAIPPEDANLDGNDANLDGGAAGLDAADAQEDWCQSQGSHLFCEDFSDGVPGLLAETDTAGAQLSLDTNQYPPRAQPPRSMLATTPALASQGNSGSAIGSHAFTTDGIHPVLQAEFNVSSSCFAHGDKDGVTIASLTFPEDRYLLAIVVASNSSELVELSVGLDGGISNAAVHPFSSMIPTDRWTLVSLDVNLDVKVGGGAAAGAADTATVKVDNSVAVLTDEKLTLVPVLGARHPTLSLGASVKNTENLSSGCKVNVDEILFDISLM